MDNDDKIDKRQSEIHRGVAKLLENELNALAKDKRRTSYDLEKEYGATAKNTGGFLWRNMWRPLLLSAVLVGLFTFLISYIAIYNNSHIDIKVNEFETLNLRSLLGKLSDAESNVSHLEKERNRLEAKVVLALEQARHERDADLQALDLMHLRNRESYEERRSEIEQRYSDALVEVDELKAQLVELNAELDSRREDLNAFDSESVKKLDEDRSVVDSERFLHDQEKSRLTDDYELKLERSHEELRLSKEYDLEHQKRLVEFIISQYDPPVPQNEQLDSVKKKTGSYESVYRETSAISDLASGQLKNVLAKRKPYIEDFSQLKKTFLHFPQSASNAIMTLTDEMNRITVHSLNELAQSTVSEVNTLIAEKLALQNKVDQLTEQNEFLRQDKLDFVEAMCREDPLWKSNIDGFVLSDANLSEAAPDIYISEKSRLRFDSQNPYLSCTILRLNKKYAQAFVVLKDENFFLVQSKEEAEKFLGLLDEEEDAVQTDSESSSLSLQKGDSIRFPKPVF